MHSAAIALVIGKPSRGMCCILPLRTAKRRMQWRIRTLLGPDYDDPWPKQFEYAVKWPREDKGGVAKIEEWDNQA